MSGREGVRGLADDTDAERAHAAHGLEVAAGLLRIGCWPLWLFGCLPGAQLPPGCPLVVLLCTCLNDILLQAEPKGKPVSTGHISKVRVQCDTRIFTHSKSKWAVQRAPDLARSQQPAPCYAQGPLTHSTTAAPRRRRVDEAKGREGKGEGEARRKARGGQREMTYRRAASFL